MKIRRISLKNWMNYQSLENAELRDRVFVIGPNASGKSNLLDAFRFLRDVALPAGEKPSGGGLQKAVQYRGGLSKVRCLNAKSDNEVLFQVDLEGNSGDRWSYHLGFKGEGRANNRIVVTREIVSKNGSSILNRPDDGDKKDKERLTQCFLELTNANAAFRELSHFFSETTYLHLVPQLLKFSNLIGGNTIENDPFGQGFLHRVSATGERTRDARLRRIQGALDKVVPQFKGLRFRKDEISGQPHIEANFAHWRPIHPEELKDPKAELLRLAQRAPRMIRGELTPVGTATIGPGYNSLLSDFIRDSWSLEQAAANAPSLNRALCRLKQLATKVRR